MQVTESSFESRMSSSTAMIVAVNSLVLSCPRGPFSFFGICARHPFCAGDVLTVLSSRADWSKLKRVNRPTITDSLSMLRLYNRQCAFTLAQHANCVDRIIWELSKERNWPHISSAMLTLSNESLFRVPCKIN